MSLQFDIFQLDTSLTKTNQQTDIDIVSVSDIQEALEISEGRYAIGTVSVTATGLAADYFRDAGDIYNPYVFVVRENGTVIFHGVVDGESVDYNRRTEYTAFNVVSWEYMLAQAGNVPARSVYEAPLVQQKAELIGNRLALFYVDISTPINVGDVVVADLNRGNEKREIRMIIGSIGTDKFSKVVAGIIPQDSELVTTLAINASGTGLDGTLEEFYQQYPLNNPVSYLDITDEVEGRLLRGAFPPNDNSRPSENIYFDKLDEGRKIRLDFRDGSNNNKYTAELAFITYYFEEGGNLPAGWNSWCRIYLTSTVPTGTTFSIVNVVDDVAISLGDMSSIKILGRALYGNPGDTTTDLFGLKNPDFLASQIINSMFILQSGSVNPFGVFSHVVQSSIISGTLDTYLSRFIELPDDPMAALRVLQDTCRTFIRFEPTWDTVGDLPQVQPRIIPRKHVNTGDGSITAVAAGNVIEWSEKASDRNIKAIVVKPNKKYNKPYGNGEWIGFWYERTNPAGGADITPDTEASPQLLTKPQGEGVIEITVAEIPAYDVSAVEFGGDAEVVYNDLKLKEIAKFYWEFYNQIPRRMNGSIAERNPDILGKFASFNESTNKPLLETVFITSVSTSIRPQESRTSIEGYMSPVFISPSPTPPVAVISGRTEYVDYDGDGTVEVNLSGLNSYDNDEGELLYEWKNFSDVLLGTGPYFKWNYATAAGNYTVKLVVTNQETGLSDTASVLVAIKDPGNIPQFGGALTDYFRLTTMQEYHAASGEERGYLRMYPLISNDDIAEIRYRRTNGTALPVLDFTTGDPTTWYPEVSSFFDTPPDDGFWRCRATLAPNHSSWIEVYVEFEAATKRAPVTGIFSFDHSPIPNFAASLQLVGNDVYLGWGGDEDLSYIRYAKSTTAMPTDAAAQAGTQLMGQRNDGALIHSGLLEGQTLYVKVTGWNSNDVQSPDYDTDAVTMPVSGSAMTAPTVTANNEQNGSNLETSLTLVDPEARITRVRMWNRVGGASTWTLQVDDTGAPFATSLVSGLDVDYLTMVRWRVDWLDDNSNTQSIEGSHTEDYDADPEPQEGYPQLHVQTNGQIYVDFEGDADVASFRIRADVTSPASTIRVSVTSGSSYHGVLSGPVLSAGQKGYVRIQCYSGATFTGSVGTFDYAVEASDTGGDPNEPKILSLQSTVDENGNVKIYWSKSDAADDVLFYASRTDTTPDSGDEIYGPYTASNGTFTLSNQLSVGSPVYYVNAMARVSAVVQESQIYEVHFRHVGLIASDALRASAKMFVQTGGAFTSAAQNQIQWSSISIRVFDGTIYGPYSGSFSPLSSSPRFLYVDTVADALLTTTNTATIADDDNIVLGVAKLGSTGSSECFFVPAVGSLGGGVIITADQIAANTITAALIQAAAIDTIHLAANAVEAGQIAAGAVTATKINVTTLSAITASMGALTIDTTITMGASGSINIGSGDVVINTNGINIVTGTSDPSKITWQGTYRADVYAFDSSGRSVLSLEGDQVQLVGDTESLTLNPTIEMITLTGRHIRLTHGSSNFSGIELRVGTAKSPATNHGLIYISSGGDLYYIAPGGSGPGTQLN